MQANLHESMSRSLAKQQDEAIRQAISNHVGHENWTVEEVKPRMGLYSYQNSPLQTVTMDGQPILSMGPLVMSSETAGNSIRIRCTRGYKILNSP